MDKKAKGVRLKMSNLLRNAVIRSEAEGKAAENMLQFLGDFAGVSLPSDEYTRTHRRTHTHAHTHTHTHTHAHHANIMHMHSLPTVRS